MLTQLGISMLYEHFSTIDFATGIFNTIALSFIEFQFLRKTAGKLI